MAEELGPRGTTVNSVRPGVVPTDLNPWLADPVARERTAGLSAPKRVAEVSDIADVVAFPSSPDSRRITGQHLDATGGAALGVNLL
ncbi:SDR family oxidoreductase [Kitasatospora aureofaciens]|uniref:SDR family oxidoreductase n=1 Tax=Kitasatospora aureofaciens TaxID=1894 RepID=UPI0036F4AE38